jgi:hypothetical protein
MNKKGGVQLGLEHTTVWFVSLKGCAGNRWSGWKNIEKQWEE